MRSSLLLAAIAAATTACQNSTGALLVEITSTLQLETETDRLVVRVLDGMTTLEEESYTIGSPPRDRWPLVQQINRGAGSPDTVTIAAELRKNTSDGTLLLVGYAAIDAPLPKSGREEIELVVARACEDHDGDELGLGAGCRGADCDDDAIDRPNPRPCDEPIDGGVPPDGSDGGIDATTCGDTMDRCTEEEVCIRRACRKRCRTTADCGDRSLTCDPVVHVCLCTLPCDDDVQCRPNMCDHGCCVGI